MGGRRTVMRENIEDIIAWVSLMGIVFMLFVIGG